MNKFLFTRENKIRITTGRDNKWVEIGHDAIRSGFLKKLPGTSLPILLYLLTHTENGTTVRATPETIARFLPCNKQETKEGLQYLAKKEIITLNNRQRKITLHIENLRLNKGKSKKPGNKNKLRNKLQSYIPPGEDPGIVDQWLDDFDQKLMWELIRRVDKWFNKQKFNQTPENKFYYLMGIIDNWYEKKIYTYKRLKYFDRLYRETKTLAETYGLKNWNKLNTTQIEIFEDWLSGKDGLSLKLAKFAIKEAIRRKKDGQPSLKYIEDNFIEPFKKANVRTINQANIFLSKNNTFSKNKNKKNNKKTAGQWNDFSWDFNNFRES